MKTAIALIVLSLALLGFTASLEPFKLTLDGHLPFLSVPLGDSKAYYAARTEALTPKYRLQDYGATSLVFGLILALCSWRRLSAPKSTLGFLVLAVVAPLLTAAAFAFDLFQGQARWEFPSWADSLGIPLMGLPVLLVAGLIWAFVHVTFLAGVRRRGRAPITLVAMRRGNPWLLVVSALTALLVVAMAAEGAYWYAVPGVIWLYFYASLSSVRYRGHDA